MKYVYPACFYKEKNGRYSVEVPDFPLATFGDDLADAIYMASDAVAGRILLMLKDGEPLPRASAPGSIAPDDESGFVSMLYVDLDLLKQNHDETPVKKRSRFHHGLTMRRSAKTSIFPQRLKMPL